MSQQSGGPGDEQANREPEELATDEIRSELERLDEELEQLETRMGDLKRRRQHLSNELRQRVSELNSYLADDE